jgi:hypothetical protein
MAHGSPTDVVGARRLHVAGFTRFEFAVATIIFAIVLTMVLQRASFFRKEGDRAGALALAVNMRSALSSKVLALRTQGREDEIVQLAGANPIHWLQHPPPNYLGELDEKAAQLATAGQWYFDVKQQSVVYVLESNKNSLGHSIERICFKVESLRLPSKNANAERSLPSQAGVALNQVAE